MALPEDRYRLLFESNPMPMWVFDLHTLAFIDVNSAAIRKYGYSREEFLSMTLKDIRAPEDVSSLVESIKKSPVFSNTETWRHRRKDGKTIVVEITGHAFEFEGRAARLVLVNDVTEKQALEDQLRQAQKMEGIGRLAGGVAHDFNNLLTVILSYGRMLQADLSGNPTALSDLKEIVRAAERAADLTKQLLAFSRQQMLAPAIVDLNEIVSESGAMLKRLIGEDIVLTITPAKNLGKVKVDPGQIGQTILNLVVNARDAMPRGGNLTIETANVVLDDEYARVHPGAKAGPHVMLAVTDTGVGMDRETQARIFEPFFTTKETGKGTGLGLSTVHGIVTQSGGTVWVYSEPGRGTSFKIYFPHAEGATTSSAEERDREVIRGTETILLVEDEDPVRILIERVLVRRGYVVIPARNAQEALDLANVEPNRLIHLLLTDVVMPGMSGRELAEKLQSVRPGMRVLLMSGYTDDAIVRHGILEASMAFLPKPVTPEQLERKVRETLR